MLESEIFQKYDLLVPSKYEGGFLILALYQKMRNHELPEIFTTNDIKATLEEIAKESNQPVTQSERTIKNLLHYYLRSVPNEYGRYYLSDHALQQVELMLHKIDNPYKNYPLKESFEKYFITRFKDIQSIVDLEQRFGSEFVAGHKRIINDHLEALEEELNSAYGELNQLLHSDELDATTLVKAFVRVFKTFGERAEDITHSIASKDRFLKVLNQKVDEFYRRMAEHKSPEIEDEHRAIATYQDEWHRSLHILKDMDGFFQGVDYKIEMIRKRILNASGKLSELQENVSSHSNFRLRIKQLLVLALGKASYDKDGIKISEDFPLKEIMQEKTQLFYPKYYEFNIQQDNTIIDIPRDYFYEQEQRAEIEKEIKFHEIVRDHVQRIKDLLLIKNIDLTDMIGEISEKEDLMVALSVAVELVQYVSENELFDLEIEKRIHHLKTKEMYLWRMKLLNKEPIIDS